MSELIDTSNDGVFAKAADFGRGFVTAAIENPINGVLQIVNKAGADLPQLDLVDDARRNTAGAAGTIAGSVAGFFALSLAGNKLMGNLGGNGLGGTMLRAGITGAVFEGVFKPSDATSTSFLADRLRAGAVGASTFATMAAAGHGLNKTGLFAVPEARSFLGSVGYGGATGLAGGLAHAQSDAMFQQGKIFANPSQYISDAASFGVFGGTFGALGYGYEKLATNMRGGPTTIKSGDSSAKVWTDRSGQPVKVETVVPSINTYDAQVKVTNVKLTTGDWGASGARARFNGDSSWWMPAQSYGIREITTGPDSVRILDSNGLIRTFEPGKYTKTSDGEISRIAQQAVNARAYAARVLDNGTQRTIFNEQGRLDNFRDSQGNRMTQAIYDDSGAVKWLRLQDAGQELTFVRESGQRWTVYTDQAHAPNAISTPGRAGSSAYEWNGEITHSHGQVKTDPWKFDLRNALGTPVQVTAETTPAQLNEPILKASVFQPGAVGRPAVTVNQAGEVFIAPGSGQNAGFTQVFVNGERISQPVRIKPTDNVSIKRDVGDRLPEWETGKLEWNTDAHGVQRLGGYELRPGSVFDMFTNGKQ